MDFVKFSLSGFDEFLVYAGLAVAFVYVYKSLGAPPEFVGFVVLGGAAIISGRLYTSPLPLSVELGHTPVLGNRRKCGCGAFGCVETLISKRGLIRSYASEHQSAGPAWESLQEAVAAPIGILGCDTWPSMVRILVSAALKIRSKGPSRVGRAAFVDV